MFPFICILLTRQIGIGHADEAEAGSKIQVGEPGLNWLRNTSKLEGPALNLLKSQQPLSLGRLATIQTF